MSQWYRHRVVKRLILPGIRQAGHPNVGIAKKTLRHQAEAEMSLYLKSHHPGQMLLTEFVRPHPTGLWVIVGLTLYGPPSIEDEIIAELAKKGEA